MTEADLTKRIVRRLREAEAFASKIHGGPHQSSGLPDIVGCYKGWFFGLEVKRPGKERTLTERQARALRKIQDAGGYADVITSVGQAMEMLAKLDEWEQPLRT